MNLSKAEKTRQRIIQESSTLFNTRGYRGTSLSDIMEVTGLTKGSIYGNFKDKDEVALAVYEYNEGQMRKKLDDVWNQTASPINQLYAVTQFYRDHYKKIFSKGGCPLLNAAIEADDHVPFLRKKVRNSFSSWALALAAIIESGKKQKEIQSQIDPNKYAYTIIMLIEGGMVLSKISGDPVHLLMALDRIDLIIEKEIKKQHP